MAKTFDHRENQSPNPHFSPIQDDLYAYIWSLYSKADGYVKIMSGSNRGGAFYQTETLLDRDKLSAILCSHRFRNSDNLFISISTYRSDKNARESNLMNVCAVTVDLDFNHGRNGMSQLSQKEFNDILNHVYNLCRSDETTRHEPIPLPTYIEYGYNLRLIYLIDPFGIPRSGKQHQSCVNLFKRLFTELCKKVRTYTAFNFQPDSKPRLTSYVRVPYSYSKKDFGHSEYDEDRGEYVWISDVHRYPVCIIPVGNRYGIQELIDEVLPSEMPDWYEAWKKNGRKKKSSQKKSYYSLKDLGRTRMRDLELLQSRGWDVGYRAIMCHLYYQSALVSGLSKEDAERATMSFNDRFSIPLKPREITVNCTKSRRRYRYKDETIREMLDCESQTDLFHGIGMDNAECCRQYREREKRKRIILGETKAQKMQKQAEQVQKLREQGLSIPAIAQKLGVSVSTVKRRLKIGIVD